MLLVVYLSSTLDKKIYSCGFIFSSLVMTMENDEDLDYILQVISNKLRRNIIKLIAEEGPISYTKLMKETEVEDSGTFGFHIKKMKKLLKKNEFGEYMLNEKGLKAYKLVEELEERKVGEEKGRELAEKYKEVVINDRISFEFDEKFARKLYRDREKVIFTDIITLTIYPMPPEVFDSVVKEVSDCVTIYVPKELEHLLQPRINDVLAVKSYEGDKPKKAESKLSLPLDLGFLSGLVSKVLESVFSAMSKLDLTSSFDKAKKKELYLENNVRYVDNADLEINLNKGVLEVVEGSQGYIRVWRMNKEEPNIDITYSNSMIKLEGENGYFEVTIPSGKTRKLYIDLNGGVVKVKINNLSENVIELSGGYVVEEVESNEPVYSRIRIDGGVVKSDMKLFRYEGESRIEAMVNGGVYKSMLNIDKDTRLSVESDEFNGLSRVELNGKKILKEYSDDDFVESRSKLYITSELHGGMSSIEVRRESLK